MRRFVGISLIVLLACGVSGWAGAPLLTPGPNMNLREQDITPLFVQGTDPDGDALTFRWAIESDPTGEAFFRRTDGSEVTEFTGPSTTRVGLHNGPSFPAPSFSGMQITVKVTASDGETETSHVFNLPVVGVNLPPTVVIDTAQMGTRVRPRLTGQGLGLDARASSDPDSGDVKFLWRIQRISGGQPCESGLVLFGKETPTPGLPVPMVTARPSNPMSITLDYIVEDGLNYQTGTVTGYMASEGGCNQRPEVSASASPEVAGFGQQVTLTGSAVDPGDQLRYSWVQLDTTGEPTVALSNPSAHTTTFVAPSQDTALQFRFTAIDSQNQSASAEVSVQVSSQASGGPGDGGFGNPAIGEPVCGDSGNLPAEAEVPSLVEAEAGQTVSIRALRARDPDNTEVFVGGVFSSGVSFAWELLDGAGLITAANLQGTQSDEVTLSLPETSTSRTLQLSLLVSDAAGCGNRYAVGVYVEASAAPSGGPEAVLRYRLQDDEALQDAPSAAVQLTSPNVVVLNALANNVTGSATFQFALDQALEGGVAELEEISTQVRYLTFPQGASGTASVMLTVRDESELVSTSQISFQVEAFNESPTARVRYQIGNGQMLDAPAETMVEVVSPAEIRLDASTSSDDGTLSFAFVMQEDLASGGALLSQESEAVRLLQLQAGTEGQVRITLTVTDQQGLSDSASIEVQVLDARPVPVAAIRVMAGDRSWESGQAVSEDTIVELDGSLSQVEGENSPEGLSYSWRQTAGTPVALMHPDQAVTRFRVPELDGDLDRLAFELTVTFDNQQSEPAVVEIPIEVAPLYFSQVAFGPFLDQRFHTVILLINSRPEAAEAFVQLFDQAGLPMAAELEGEPDWHPELPLQIEAGDSRRLRFAPLDAGQTVVGWAQVRSNLRLTGLVLYQLRDQVTGDLDSEVSLYSSPAGAIHRTFFDPAYGLAAALLNPGAEPVVARLTLISPDNGPENPLASKTVMLDPGEQRAFFLNESFFGEFGGLFETATLLVEADGGQVAATVLKTRDGVAISSLPLAAQ